VFVDDIHAPRLTPEDQHHLARVLRLRPGAAVTVCDGRGSWRAARFGDVVEPAGPVAVVPPPDPPLTVAFALVKGARPELVVQKLTEVGVDRIVPFATERSVVRWDAAKRAAAVIRLRRVAREASMQCRRCHLPEVGDVVEFADVAALAGAVAADGAGRPLRRSDTTVLVGPEGGWSDAERARNLPTVALGSHVLRAETAAVAAGVLMAALRAGLVQEV
jgi:16S rRNA (uracil1498-N3)-methyltransferase